MARPSKHPWHEIRDVYVRTGRSLRELAKRFGCGVRTIESRAYREDWKEQRRVCLLQIERRRQAGQEGGVAEQLDQFDADICRMARIAVAIVNRRIATLGREAADIDRRVALLLANTGGECSGKQELGLDSLMGEIERGAAITEEIGISTRTLLTAHQTFHAALGDRATRPPRGDDEPSELLRRLMADPQIHELMEGYDDLERN